MWALVLGLILLFGGTWWAARLPGASLDQREHRNHRADRVPSLSTCRLCQWGQLHDRHVAAGERHNHRCPVCQPPGRWRP